jgi:hypothetical protein
MIYLIDDPIENFDPIEEVNKYIDAQFVSEGHMMFTATILADPDKVLNSLSHDAINKERREAMFPIANYTNVFRLCYTSEKTYLVPAGDNVSIDVLASRGYMSMNTGGSVIVPKGELPLKTIPYDGEMYTKLINATPDLDFLDLMFKLGQWAMDSVEIAKKRWCDLTE